MDSFGFASNQNSARPCGCDPGCNGGYLCERHRASVCVTTCDSISDGASSVSGNQVKVIKDAKWRKERPLWSGCLRYFPDALLEVAYVSFIGNEQHNPGEPLHWDRSKSTDEADACVRHLVEAGSFDSDGLRHSAKAAWRALSNLQKEMEQEGAGKE
jgi:hypothetical protein